MRKVYWGAPEGEPLRTGLCYPGPSLQAHLPSLHSGGQSGSAETTRQQLPRPR